MPLNPGLPQHNVVVLGLLRFLTLPAMHGNFNQDLQHDVKRERLNTAHHENQGSILAILSSDQQKVLSRS